MKLNTVDTGLIADHLPAHEGTIARFQHYVSLNIGEHVKSILFQQIEMMQNHVQVMQMLVDPNHHGAVNLPPFQALVNTFVQGTTTRGAAHLNDRQITLDARFTAISMAIENFTSAMAMKTLEARHVHVNMALQNAQIAEHYDMLIRQAGWEHPPMATEQEQLNTAQHFYQFSNSPAFQAQPQQNRQHHQ